MAQTQLTPEQQERIQRNLEAALERKRQLEKSGYTTPNVKRPQLSQESTISTKSATNTSSNGSAKKTPTNPYLNSKPTCLRSPSPPPQHLHLKVLEENSKRIELQIVPPLPEDAPKIRYATVNSLSEQQLEVVRLARPPTPISPEKNCSGIEICSSTETTQQNGKNGQKPQKPGYMVRVTAAAGTGKTTTLLHLAVRCLDLGHQNVTYVSFTRASAGDAKKRILDMLKFHNQSGSSGYSEDSITASTLHSCAMKLVSSDEDYDLDTEKGITNDNGLETIIKKEFKNEIEHYLDPGLKRMKASTEEKKRKEKERGMREIVVYYLKKSFLSFCQGDMTFEQLKDEKNYRRNWFALRKNFLKDGPAEKLGFPPEIYALPRSYKFYADTCVKLWKYVIDNGIRMYDSETKKAQLKKMCIPCSVLLVDECQDLNACQVDFVAKQKDFGTQVFFVGDAAQTIYSFRGAKSSNVMSLPDCVDRLLNKSWRFGPAIAQVANIALFVKENSPATTEYIRKDNKQWIPYRVETAKGEEESVVTTRSLLQRDWWNKRPVTIIGTRNDTLLKKALELMNLEHLEQQGGDGLGDDSSTDGVGINKTPDDLDEFQSSIPELLRGMPKFHINGKGESSGARGWRKSIKQVKHLHELFMAQDAGGTLPANLFPDFSDYDKITWGEFLASFKARELNHYVKPVNVIGTYGRNTMKAIKVFEAQLDAKHSEENADFILTTCHSAKGLEWDHVELCDDFLNLQTTSYICSRKALSRPPFLKNDNDLKSDEKPVRRTGWQFATKSYGDDLNLIYVACTRAKKTLSLPKTIENVLREFDLIHFCVNDFKKAVKTPVSGDESMIVLHKEKKKLSKGEVWDLYQDLCLPLRNELGVGDDCKIMKALFSVDDDDDMEDDRELAEGADQIDITTKEEEQSQYSV